MVKQIMTKILISMTLFSTLSTPSIAQTKVMAFGFSVDYLFKPNEPQEIVNNFFFTIKAKCKIKSTDESNDILSKILNGTGTFNSQQLNTGEELTLTIRNKDIINIVAPSGTKVRITNLGINEVTAVCSPA